MQEKTLKRFFGRALNIIKHFGPQSLWLLAVGLLDKSFFRWEFFLVESFFIWEFFLDESFLDEFFLDESFLK